MKVGAGIIGAVALYYVKQHRTAYLADRDAAFRHYVELHPEYFPPPGLYNQFVIWSTHILVLLMLNFKFLLVITFTNLC